MHRIFLLIFFFWNSLIKIPTTTLKFPKNFIFGSSSSSYQTEGAWDADGKGENIWDRLTHTRPNLILDGTNGDDAAKSYHLYKSDADMLKEIGFQTYRFSISWSRILPNGDLSEINQAGIDHYNDMINYLLEKNIEPLITIHHADLPQKLQDTGGWLNSSTIDHITEFADLLFHFYGDRVKWWLTINEPYLIVQGYSGHIGAPALDLGTPADYKVGHNLLIAHMRIYRLYEKKYKTRQKGKITISLNYDPCMPKTESEEDKNAAERHFQFQVGFFAHPIYSTEGDYPKIVRDIVSENSKKEGYTESRLPAFTEEEKSSLKGSYDYFSFNHYSSYLCSPLLGAGTANTNMPITFTKDMGVQPERDPSLPVTASQFVVNPKAFRIALNKISKNYNYPEIFVTENGYGDYGQLEDKPRIDFFRDYLTELLNAYHYDKCNIIGYCAYSLLDSFEWRAGYTVKFGLIGVDFSSPNRTRTRKQSSYYFQELITRKEIQPA